MVGPNRRTFFSSSVVCATAAVVAAEAADATTNASGVAGYSYRLPKFSQGTTLLFQGDSITDMQWGRGQVDRLRPIVAKLSSEFGAILLQTQAIFEAAAQRAEPSHWIWDGVHPLPQGHELIARHWIDAVAKTWT